MEEEKNIKIPKKKLKFMTNKSLQFVTDKGLIFENLIKPENPEMKISLLYWVNDSINFDDFIDKISNYCSEMGSLLTNNDVNGLKTHIEKYTNLLN